MENLASGLAAVFIIGLAIFISFRSYNQLINPHPIETPLIETILTLITTIIAGFFRTYKYNYNKGKKSKMSAIKLETFNTIKDRVSSGFTVITLILSSQGIYIADGIFEFIIVIIIVIICFPAIKESSYMLIDACNGECIDIKTSV